MRSGRDRDEVQVGRAFAPAHVTGLFAPALGARDPRGRGSVGAGIVLDAGVTAVARYDPSGPRRATVRADGLPGPLPISLEAARRLLPRDGGSLDVRLRHDLPIGQGFGSSAAGALATALSGAAATAAARSRAVEVAHLADLFGGGGLGGVAAILGGGLELRERAGLPPWGSVRHRGFLGKVILSVVGAPLPSARLLGRAAFLERVRSASEAAASDGLGGFGPKEFLAASERFTDALGLAPRELRATIAALRRCGAWSAQAMLGRALFCVPRGPAARSAVFRELARRRLPAVELQAARRGARLLRGAASAGGRRERL